MQKSQIILLALYLLVQCAEYWLKFLNLRHMKEYGNVVPRGFEEFVDEATLRKANSYTVETTTLALAESVFGSILLLLFLFSGLLGWYNSWVNSLGLPFVFRGIVFFLLLSYAGTLLTLPFDLYGTFRIENRYGFNTMTFRLWLADFFKSWVLSTLIAGVLIVGGLTIIRQSPDRWWVFVWGFFFVFSIFMMYLSPYVIEPLFNKFTPLEGDELVGRIREMMQRAGIRVSRVFTMDASKRSRHTNAYFSGIGKVKRIVLFDTLLAMMSGGEILAVLAHEAGHWKKKHVLKSLALFEVISLGAAYLSFRLLGTDLLSNIFGLQGETFFAKLVILGFLYSIASFPFMPFFSYLSRRHEDQADRFAVGLTSDAESLATSLIKLSKDNLSNLHPHPLYARFYYSHPPVVERIGRIRGYH